MFFACLFQHSWRGLAELSPSAFSEGGRNATVEPVSKLEFHVGWPGWTRPPTTGGGRVGRQRGGLQRGSRGGFKKVPTWRIRERERERERGQLEVPARPNLQTLACKLDLGKGHTPKSP